jgi:hypothetical protein
VALCYDDMQKRHFGARDDPVLALFGQANATVSNPPLLPANARHA